MDYLFNVPLTGLWGSVFGVCFDMYYLVSFLAF